MREREDHAAALAAIGREVAAAKADRDLLRKTIERALQQGAGLEQQASSLATAMGMPSFRSMGSDLTECLR
eukprot:7369828-Pyramimonas_sp.AAC.1